MIDAQKIAKLAGLATLVEDPPGSIALCYFPQDETKVFWTSIQETAAGPYTAASTLIQLLMRKRKPGEMGSARIFTTGALDGRANSMATFIGIQSRIQNTIVDHDVRGVSDLKLEHLPPEKVTNRSSLTEFTSFWNALKGSTPVIPPLTVTPSNPVDHTRTLHRIYMMTAYELLAYKLGVCVNHAFGHNIAAVLVAKDGAILAWGINHVNLNYTYHAEINALQSYFLAGSGRPVPAESRIYTTLKPCKMCASMIVQNPGLQVYYAQEDLGSHAVGTDLDSIGRQFRLDDNNGKPIRAWKEADLGEDGTYVFPFKPDLPYKRKREHEPAPAEAIHDVGKVLRSIEIDSAKGSVAQSQKTTHAADTMKFAGKSLEDKMKKYDTANAWRNTKVWEALQYVRAFLRAVGVPNW